MKGIGRIMKHIKNQYCFFVLHNINLNLEIYHIIMIFVILKFGLIIVYFMIYLPNY